MEKLLLVDGSNLLFQMFYGMPSRIVSRDGKAIQGTLGFVGALLKILRRVQPDYVAVIFDGEYTSYRMELDDNYKANRMDYSKIQEEETPFSQLPDIFRGLKQLEISYWETTACEADDILAGYALTYGKRMDIVIVSQDSDLFQLVGEHVRIFRYRGEKSVLCDDAYIREKYGIEPKQYAAFKSLTGDPSDNIRGVDKIGPKTASALLKQFGSLDRLLVEYDSITKPSIRASIQQNAERIQKNYQLICLTGHEKLPFLLNSLRYRDKGFTTTQVLQQIGLK